MPPDLPHPGELLAGYRIERQLGRGATGVVFLARQVALDRPVALKVVGAPFAVDEAFRERFRHEARAAAALDHPNVVTVLDSGEDDERLWLAMRLVDGPDLRVLLRRTGRLEPAHAVSVVEQVAAALDAAHAAGLVHRDVKPGNVLVEDAPGGALHVELADFGLVGGAGGPPAAAGPDPDGENVIEGTPDYAAPEQLAGQEATAAADVYGLGRVFAEMLTGDPATPVGPGATGFAAVVARATDPDPAWRYPTAGAMAVAARAVLEPGRADAGGVAGPAAAGSGVAGAVGTAGAASAAAAASSGAEPAIDPAVPAVAGSLPSPDEVQADIEYEEVASLSPVPSASRSTGGRGPATTLVAAPRRRRRRWWRVLPLVVLLGVVAATALFFGELRDGMLESDPARDRNRSTATAGGSGSGSGANAGSSSRGSGSGSSGTGTQGATAGGAGAGSSDRGSAGAGSAGSAPSETAGGAGGAPSGTGSTGASPDAAAAGSASASAAGSSDSAAAGSMSASGTDASQAVDVTSSAPVLGGAGPSTAPTADAFPPARGKQRFGGGSWALDLPANAGWHQNAVQELSGGRMLLTRLRRDDGTRLVVEHRPGQTAVFGPWPGQAFAVRVPDAGRTAALLFRGGRYAMCREAVCAAVPVNGPSGGVLLIVSAASDVQARRELRRAASGLRVS